MAQHPTIGNMQSRILFQSSVKTQNAQFSFDYNWINEFEIWGQIKQSPGLMFTKNDNIEPDITHIINVRYRTDITRSMRLLNNNNEYTIHRIVPFEEGNKRYIQLQVELQDAEA